MKQQIIKKMIDRANTLGFRVKKGRISIGGTWVAVAKAVDHQLDTNKLYTMLANPEIRQIVSKLPMSEIYTLMEDVVTKMQSIPSEADTKHWEKQNKLNTFLQHHEVYIDIHTGKYFLWFKKNRRISEWNPDAVFKELGRDVFEQLINGENAPRLAKPVFRPFRGLQRYWDAEDEGTTIRHINTYIAPAWYEVELSQQKIKQGKEDYPLFFSRFLQHLFPVEPHRDTFLDWLTLAMFSRPISFLSLRGARGNGKTILKHIIFHLVGSWHDASSDILGQFNADLRGKRIVGLDDNDKIGTYDGHRIRKFMLSPTLHINEKHIQTTRSEAAYFSLIIASNTSDRFYIEHDERRIVSPTMSDKKLEKSIKNKIFLDRLFRYTKDELDQVSLDNLRQIGESLIIRYHKRLPDPNLQLKAGYFWNDVLHSLSGMKQYCLNYILTTPGIKQVEYDEIKALFKFEVGSKNITYWSTFSGWLRSGFTFQEKPLILDEETDIDFKNKLFYPNPELIGLYAKRD